MAAKRKILKKLQKAADAARKRVSRASRAKRDLLLAAARIEITPAIPPWKKPPTNIPVQKLREFISAYGPDVSVLVTWSHEEGKYQFVTIGCDQLYANAAVNLRNLIVDKLKLHPLSSTLEDLRDAHPNVSLTGEQIDFLLWLLGRVFAETHTMENRGKAKYVHKHHDPIFYQLSHAKWVLVNQPR